MIEKYENSGQNAECQNRQPIAIEVVQFADRIACQAQALAERVNDKLYSVMTSDCQRPYDVVGRDSIEYPPLFSDLRAVADGALIGLCAVAATHGNGG